MIILKDIEQNRSMKSKKIIIQTYVTHGVMTYSIRIMHTGSVMTPVTQRVDGVTDDLVTMVAAFSTAISEVPVLLESAGASFNVASPMLIFAMVLSPALKIPPLLVVTPAGVTTDCFL